MNRIIEVIKLLSDKNHFQTNAYQIKNLPQL